ncbi:hypothetical protein BJ912DRAFT_927555 [Pholiota molesta]|nr:hypothetical protein BJ912DRAFT_927555 [Pholiota molesta]
MTFSPHPGVLNLLQLAVIIEAVHDLEERYALDRTQCYWLAMLIMGAAMTRGGQVRYFERGRGKAEIVQELSTVASTSDLSHIPILPPPPDKKGELVKAPGLSHIAISPPPPDEKGELVEAPVIEGSVRKYHCIQIIAGEAERRYNNALVALEARYASFVQGHQRDAAKRIEELQEENRKKDKELGKKDEDNRQLRLLLSQQQPQHTAADDRGQHKHTTTTAAHCACPMMNDGRTDLICSYGA